MSATSKAMEALHEALAEKLAEGLEDLDLSEKGAASVLGVIRQFLKDNGIQAVPQDTPEGERPATAFSRLVKETEGLPFDTPDRTEH